MYVDLLCYKIYSKCVWVSCCYEILHARVCVCLGELLLEFLNTQGFVCVRLCILTCLKSLSLLYQLNWRVIWRLKICLILSWVYNCVFSTVICHYMYVLSIDFYMFHFTMLYNVLIFKFLCVVNSCWSHWTWREDDTSQRAYNFSMKFSYKVHN